MFGGSSFGGKVCFAKSGSEDRMGDVPERQPVGGRREDAELRSRAATRMFAGLEFWGLNDGICLFVANAISLAEEDFFSPIPGPFQN